MNTQTSAQLSFDAATPLPAGVEPAALKQQAAARIAAHRGRRKTLPAQPSLLQDAPAHHSQRAARAAAAVAARYAKAQSYREYLAAEAEEALQRAQAAAEMAARTAEAIAAQHEDILAELEEHEAAAADAAWLDVALAPALVKPVEPLHSAPSSDESLAAASDFVLEVEPPATPTPLPTNMIEFPRVLVAPRKARPRLAEGPLREESDAAAPQLRIFEVDALTLSPQPAQISTQPVWSSIRLDEDIHEAAVEHVQAPAPAFAIPIHPSTIGARIRAFATDSALVGVGTAIFAAGFIGLTRHAGMMPQKKFIAIAAVGAFFVLKLIYQLLFFTFNESTPGMRSARIGVCTFADDNPTRSALRRRVFATLMAAVPMGLGLVWAGFDDDRLGWHDRISRTYQRSY